ncbi:endo alpha-1,4 polygalactosaminidase [Chelativorans sp. Marseille-P2723]|uniref:endo alpha-1,4 polygalactosaminidase n=1 Tax=Chelativorans sp. Marseille-P2723 TaxID=2709133 RepID=UPI0015709CEE|nr:endo alpha-1,4 polygalactosaminidase [Chelativorans sp. Marseille-P2723]
MKLSEISASNLDLIIIDASLDDGRRRFVTPDERRLLQRKPNGQRRIVLGYLCVGEADVKRWYWPPQWREQVPDWVGPENPKWPGSRYVRYWDDRWQSMVFRAPDSILDRILDIGFDGVLIDRADAYLDWEKERPTAQQDMIDLIAELAAKARGRDPGFILLPQNAELLLTRQRYLDLIDAHNKESLLTGLKGEGIENDRRDVVWSLGYLRKAQAAGIKMLATEYLADMEAIASARKHLTSLGFLPFFGHRQLDRLPLEEC